MKTKNDPGQLFDPVFTLFEYQQQRRGRKGRQFTTSQLQQHMASPSLKCQTEILRHLYRTDINEYRALKETLDVIINSHNGHGCKAEFLRCRAKWNRLIGYDLDLKKNGKVLMARNEAIERIHACPFIYMAFPSASDDGFGIFIRTDTLPNCSEAQTELFRQINRLYFDDILDIGRKDISGCRYIAYCAPEEFYVNPYTLSFQGCGIPYLSDHELKRTLHRAYADFDDADDANTRIRNGEWRADGLYAQESVGGIISKHEQNKIEIIKATFPTYSYMGLPYGQLLLTQKAPKKEYTVRRPDINPSSLHNPPRTSPATQNIPVQTTVLPKTASPTSVVQTNPTMLNKIPPSKIQPGQRNNYLTSCKGFLSRLGHTEDYCAAKIAEINKCFSHPLPESEVKSITYYSNANPCSQGHESRDYTVDAQYRMDINTAWKKFNERFIIFKSGNPNKILLPAEVTLLFKSHFPELKSMAKSDHALVCFVGRMLQFDRKTWENDPNGIGWENIEQSEAYSTLNPQEIIHAEVNQSRTVVRSKNLDTKGIDPDSIGFKTVSSKNRGYVGYEIVERSQLNEDSQDEHENLENKNEDEDVDTISLTDLIFRLQALDGDQWIVNSKYLGRVSGGTEKVLTILAKYATVKRRQGDYSAKLRKQWDEAMLLFCLSEQMAGNFV